jgi:hypothetical protein
MSTTMVGALAPRMLAMVSIPSHHKQWGMARFENRGEEGCCRLNSLKIEMAGYGAWRPCPTTYTIGETEAT